MKTKKPSDKISTASGFQGENFDSGNPQGTPRICQPFNAGKGTFAFSPRPGSRVWTETQNTPDANTQRTLLRQDYYQSFTKRSRCLCVIKAVKRTRDFENKRKSS
jgi:hypothetical protein